MVITVLKLLFTNYVLHSNILAGASRKTSGPCLAETRVADEAHALQVLSTREPVLAFRCGTGKTAKAFLLSLNYSRYFGAKKTVSISSE